MRCFENHARAERKQPDGTIYLVLEFAGQALSKYMLAQRAQLTLPAVLELERQLFAGLAFLERQGFVHHDLKPVRAAVSEQCLLHSLYVGVGDASHSTEFIRHCFTLCRVPLDI